MALLPPGGAEGRLSRACAAAWEFLSSLIKVFCSSPQSVPESAELKRVSAHVRVNWAMLEGEDSSLACFSWVTFSRSKSTVPSRGPLLGVRTWGLWGVCPFQGRAGRSP